MRTFGTLLLLAVSISLHAQPSAQNKKPSFLYAVFENSKGEWRAAKDTIPLYFFSGESGRFHLLDQADQEIPLKSFSILLTSPGEDGRVLFSSGNTIKSRDLRFNCSRGCNAIIAEVQTYGEKRPLNGFRFYLSPLTASELSKTKPVQRNELKDIFLENAGNRISLFKSDTIPASFFKDSLTRLVMYHRSSEEIPVQSFSIVFNGSQTFQAQSPFLRLFISPGLCTKYCSLIIASIWCADGRPVNMALRLYIKDQP